MSILVTILARAGSKGLPVKNTKLINGKPLIMWTVEQAKAWGKGQIVVSSDSPDICSMVTNSSNGIAAYIRRPEMAEDDTPKLDSLRAVLHQVEPELGKFDTIIDLDVTNPLRLPDDIEKAYQKFVKEDKDVLMSVTKAKKNPYFNQLLKYGDYYDSPSVHVITRRQDAPEVFDVNSCIYIYKRDFLINEDMSMPHWGISNCIYLMQKWQAQDIDDIDDFDDVEKMMRKKGIC